MARRSIEIGLVLSTLVGLGVACGTDSGGPPKKGNPPPAAGGEGGDGAGVAGSETTTGGTAPSGRPRTRVPENDGGMGGEPPSGEGGEGGNPGDDVVLAVACMGDPGVPPMVAVCGDGFRAATEECDDGNAAAADSCTSMCRVTDSRPLAPPPTGIEQVLGSGRHPFGAGCVGSALAFAERNSSSAAIVDISVARFDRQGVPRGVTRDVSQATTPAAEPNPVVAELGSNAFAVAWTDVDGDGDGLGIALRSVAQANGTLGPLVFANETTFFAQSDPDLLWTGSTLVAAWVDYSDPVDAPDVKLRRFDINLQPLAAEETLATTSRNEADVALASFAGSWAAAWRSSADGMETIEVRAGQSSWTVGPFLPGAVGDRPALVELNSQRLLLVFTEGTDPAGNGVADVPRLRGAVLAAPGPTPSFVIAPRVSPYATDASLGQAEPNVLFVDSRFYVSWRSSGVVSDPLGDEIWLKEIGVTFNGIDAVLNLGINELPLPRSDAHRTGDQRAPALFPVPIPFGAAIAAAWMDFGPFGTGPSAPGPVVEFLPTPILRVMP